MNWAKSSLYAQKILHANHDLMAQEFDDNIASVESKSDAQQVETQENKISDINDRLRAYLKEIDACLADMDAISDANSRIATVTFAIRENCESLLAEEEFLQQKLNEVQIPLAHFQTVDNLCKTIGLGNKKQVILSPTSEAFATDFRNLQGAKRYFADNRHEFAESEAYYSNVLMLESRYCSIVRSYLEGLVDKVVASCKTVSVHADTLATNPLFLRFRSLAPVVNRLMSLMSDYVDVDDDVSNACKSCIRLFKLHLIQRRSSLAATHLRPFLSSHLSLLTDLSSLSSLSSLLTAVAFPPDSKYDAIVILRMSCSLCLEWSRYESELIACLGCNSMICAVLESGVFLQLEEIIRPIILDIRSQDKLCQLIEVCKIDLVEECSLCHDEDENIKKVYLAIITSIAKDATERLIFLVSNKLRTLVDDFVPSESNLNYPTLLNDDGNIVYPPVFSLLVTLSSLFAVLDPSIFQDISCQFLSSCIRQLESSSSSISTKKGPLHGQLFIVRHLLRLKEELNPFDVELKTRDSVLDFSPTSGALSKLIQSTKRSGAMIIPKQFISQPNPSDKSSLLWDMSISNPFVMFARDGLPMVKTTEIDIRDSIDRSLYTHCDRLIDVTCCQLLESVHISLVSRLVSFAAEEGYDTSHGRFWQYDENSKSDPLDVIRSFDSSRLDKLSSRQYMSANQLASLFDNLTSFLTSSTVNCKAYFNLYVSDQSVSASLWRQVAQQCRFALSRLEKALLKVLGPSATCIAGLTKLMDDDSIW